jgi:N-acetylneuraminic acid mutarotase
MGGSDSNNVAGVYGQIGVASAGNAPGARIGAVGWTDRGGDLWMFGGFGDSASSLGSLNDLWQYDPTSGMWTWQSGSSGVQASGVYGAFRVASAANVPGARGYASSWTDSSGNLWLFGGMTTDSSGNDLYFNDLWEFNPTNKEWTWVSGSSQPNQPGVYSTLGTAETSNTPGARNEVVSWTDRSGNFWLFGGFGPQINPYGNGNTFNDLWKFDPTTEMWTWMSGSNAANVAGTYGTKGMASTSNVPGSRAGASGWIDSKGNLWLYGGSSNLKILGDLADLWEFSPATNEWMWVAGSNLSGQYQQGVYGTQGVPSDPNTPGGTGYLAASWIDGSDNLWLFGGWSETNALWKFNPKTNQWVWMSGSNTAGANGSPGTFGTKGVPSATNEPPGRESAISWTDKNGNFWLFGGESVAPFYNDLWRYQP